MSFADDLAQLHADCDEAFASAATFRPATGGAFPCLVEVFQPEPEFGGAEVKTVAPDIVLRVVKASLPQQPKRDDVFEVGSDDLSVLVKPTTEDDDGLRWTIKVARARQ